MSVVELVMARTFGEIAASDVLGSTNFGNAIEVVGDHSSVVVVGVLLELAFGLSEPDVVGLPE